LKNKGFNLNTMIVIWKTIISCDILGLEENYWGTFGHAFSKAYQYVTINENIYKDLTYVYSKTMQRNLQKCKMWPQIFGKCEQHGRRHVLNLVFPKEVEHSSEDKIIF
jgi:hypothetical protein